MEVSLPEGGGIFILAKPRLELYTISSRGGRGSHKTGQTAQEFSSNSSHS